MKEGFTGSPIGLRITKRDADILRYLAKTMYPGLTVSLSDVARVLMREGMKSMGIMVVPQSNEELPEGLPPGVTIDPTKKPPPPPLGHGSRRTGR